MPADAGNRKPATYEPESMVDVRNKFSQLRGIMGSFNEKVSDVLSKAEVQYLQAYRAHMQSVHAEKVDLEAKLRQAESQQANDQQMRALEKDVEWYRRQKQQLESAAVAMQKDLLYMQERFDVLTRDRNTLSIQVKSLKKVDRVVKAEAKEVARQQRQEDAAKEAEQEERRYKLERARAAAAAASSVGVADTEGKSWNGGGADEWSYGEEFAELTGEEGAVELRRRLRFEKERLLRERAEVQRLRTLVVGDRSLRGELEEFFLMGVEDLRKEGGRRRRREKEQQNRNDFEGGGGSRNSTSSNRVPGVLLTDKQMESDLTLLFDALFPSPSGGGDVPDRR
mmetsp:Transcript_35590/g.72531  ORF Transcript_35590/g.72531 Transcript_35590/m.72531 type:complete len:339 (+) Transcript_35590:58-1074(+)